jgi:hypothetical protein
MLVILPTQKAKIRRIKGKVFEKPWTNSSGNPISKKQNKKPTHYSWAPVAHFYNPSYSGGRDQEDPDLKPACASSL